MKRVLVVVLAVVLFIGALVVGWNFMLANAIKIEIDLLWMTIAEVSVWQVALAAFGFGAGLVFLGASFLYARGALLRHRYRREIRRLESELHQLRSLPLASTPDTEPAPATASAEGAVGGAA